MPNDNRPQGRNKRIGGSAGGLERRGEGLNTGPVGSGSSPRGSAQNGRPSASGTQFTENGGGGDYRGNRGGGRSPLLIIILVVVLLFGGGGGALSGLLGTSGGSDGTQSYVQPTPKPGAVVQAPTTSVSGISSTILQGIAGSSTQSDWKEPANVATVSSTVASGSRDKFTQIRGRGRDIVTVMVYMCGTDLEAQGGMATKDLIEMTKATIGDKVNLIVYTGGCTRWNNNVVSASKNQIFQVVSGNLKVLESNAGSVSMTDPDTLASFIGYCRKNFEADRYELILWDHGGGSVSGYGYDQKYPSSGSMSLSGIKTALDKAGVKFDFIGFDACLMATVENALMLSGTADYLIASEETEPGTGWYYTNWLTKLSSNTSMSTVDIGKNIVDDFVSVCAQSASSQSATLSVVDLAELSNTVPAALRSFSESLSGMIADNEYKQISAARSNTREFARSTAIDQIDLVHFASNVGNAEGKALTQALLGAVKYNRTSSNMNNSYGLSIYFPYRKLSNVDKAIRTYDAIGMDESYSQCIREFAGLETGGQVSTGGYTNPFSSLFGDYSSYAGSYGGAYGSSSSSSSSSADLISTLIGAFLCGDYSSIAGSYGSTDYFTGRSMSTEDTARYIADNLFDPANLVWRRSAAGEQVIAIGEDQWSLVTELDLNMFYDDGSGYIDLGLDNVFDFDDNGDLLAPREMTWLAINGQFVAYYHEYTTGSGSETVISGYVPVLLNGERAELLINFDAEGYGRVIGARFVYADGQTDTVAKSMTARGAEADLTSPDAQAETGELCMLQPGDTIDFIFDYYSYDGEYQDSYIFGPQMVVEGELEIYDAYLPAGRAHMTYRFTDIYQQHYWSLPIEG